MKASKLWVSMLLAAVVVAKKMKLVVYYCTGQSIQMMSKVNGAEGSNRCTEY